MVKFVTVGVSLLSEFVLYIMSFDAVCDDTPFVVAIAAEDNGGLFGVANCKNAQRFRTT